MKNNIWISLTAGCGLCLAQFACNAQEYKEHFSKQFTVQPNSVLALYNIAGSLKIEGYSGNKIMIEADETISSKNPAEVEKGKNEFKLAFEQKGDSVLAYIAAPFDSRPQDNYHSHHHDAEVKYHYLVNYTVKVPYITNLRISTINDGGISIKDVAGRLNVNNINGAISIANARGATDAHTINGDLTVSYTKVPEDASNYYTLNGKLEVVYPANFSANVQLKTFNGQFYTDFEDAVTLPARVIATKQKNGSGTSFKLDKNSEVKIGNGGKLFKFETFNGNIYIKKQA